MDPLLATTSPPLLSSTSVHLPPGLYLERGQLFYQWGSTVYQLCPFPATEAGRMEEIFELSKQAGFDDTLEDWRQHLRFAKEFAYAFIDTKTRRLITTGMAVVFDQRVVRIIDILTEQSHRNRGLAKTLFGYLLYVIGQNPHLESLELEASASGSALYEKFSFKTDYQILSYVKQALQQSERDANNGDDLLMRNGELERIIQMDQEACGFSRADLIREVPKEQILVDRQVQQIGGFLFYFEDANGIRIGPWVHKNKESAEAFLNRSILAISKRHPAKKIYIHTPLFGSVQESGVIKILDKLGFVKENLQTYHMSKGVKLSRDKQSYFAMWSTNWA